MTTTYMAKYTAETLNRRSVEQIIEFFKTSSIAGRGQLTHIERQTLSRAADDLTTILSWADEEGA